MIIAVASGKGGTGKTTVATSLALSLAPDRPVLFLDCDVEAPNAHLLLHPTFTRQTDANILLPVIDASRCNLCGTCAQVCQYNALAVAGQRVLVFPDLCHGCGNCTLNCPSGAIREVPYALGTLEQGTTPEGIRFGRGTLHVGQSWTIPVIRQLKAWLPPNPDETVIIDAPPGTSCPVADSVRDADYVLLVTEPTPFGLHDLQLAHALLRELERPAGVIINRDGIGDRRVDDFCAQAGLPVLLRIPMERAIAGGLAQGIPLARLKPEYHARFRELGMTLAGVTP